MAIRQPSKAPEFYTPLELAAMFNCKPERIYKRITYGDIPAIRDERDRKLWLISGAVVKLLKESKW